MIPTSGSMSTMPAQVQQGSTMIRDESFGSKGGKLLNLTKSRSKTKFPSKHDQNMETFSSSVLHKKPLPRTRTPSQIVKSESARGFVNLKAELEHKRKLWRVFRRKMNLERQIAIETERQQKEESDAILQQLEREKEFGSTLHSSDMTDDDSDHENMKFEMLVPSIFQHEECYLPYCEKDCETVEEVNMKKEKGPWSFGSGFWDFLGVLSGQSWKETGLEDSYTVATADETSMASDYSMSSESEASRYSWQSADTEIVSNRGGTRDLLIKHFGGENDSPWLAAKRGDMNALENRWKYRHDWTLEDEHGNTPLYYACRYGGEKNLRVVLFLLQQWPSNQHIPPDLMNRCKLEAANVYVQELLINPCHAEAIINDYEQCYAQQDKHEDNDYGNEFAGKNDLYKIFEDDSE